MSLRPPFSSVLPGIFRAAIFGAAAIVANLLPAQTAGLIGQRFVETSPFFEDIRTSGISNGTGITIRLNTPVRRSLDFSVAGSFEKIDTNRFREQQLLATLTAHHTNNGFTPFADLSLGNTWQSSSVGGNSYSDHHGFYAVGAGVEAAVGDVTAIFGRIGFNKYFQNELGDYWLFSVGLNHWLGSRTVLTGAVTFRDNDSVLYGLGVGFRF